MGNQCLCGLLAVEGDVSLVTVKEEKVLSNSSGSCKANAGTYRSSCAGKHAMDDPKVSSETLSDCVCALLSPEDKSNCVVNKQSCDGKHHFDSDTMKNQCLCGLLAAEGDASLVTVKEEKVL